MAFYLRNNPQENKEKEVSTLEHVIILKVEPGKIAEGYSFDSTDSTFILTKSGQIQENYELKSSLIETADYTLLPLKVHLDMP